MDSYNLKVSEEAIKAITALASALESHPEELGKEITALKNVYEDNKDGLGPNAEDIRKLLEDLGEDCTSAGVKIKKLVLKLQMAAMFRRKILEQNGYGRCR